jgi:hypothetical protein
VVSFTPRPLYLWERAANTHWKVGWVGPETDLDDVKKKKVSALPGPELRPLDIEPVASRYTGSRF